MNGSESIRLRLCKMYCGSKNVFFRFLCDEAGRILVEVSDRMNDLGARRTVLYFMKRNKSAFF